MNAKPDWKAEEKATPAATASSAISQQDNPGALRKRILAARSALTVTQRHDAERDIMAHLENGLASGPAQTALRRVTGRRPVVAAFWPIRGEPDLRPLLAHWAATSYDIALPVTTAHAPLEFHRWQPGQDMRNGRYGIPEPVNTARCDPDVVLVPTLGYTDDAHRLGYGGGYYDRTLAALRAAGKPPVAIGVALTCGRLASDEHEAAAHDARLDAVVDETGWVIPPFEDGRGPV